MTDQPSEASEATPGEMGETGDTGQTGETGDIVIDAALRDLESTDPEDLDAQIEAGDRVHRTLQGRLSDLGGE